MAFDALWKLEVDGETVLAAGPSDEGPQHLLAMRDLDALISAGPMAILGALGTTIGRVPSVYQVLAPIGSQPVWASGVTYERSRAARNAESAVPDVYDRVYEAERPELFLKAMPGTVRGPGETVGIRADSTWGVPEPELTLVLDGTGVIAGFCCEVVVEDSVRGSSIHRDLPELINWLFRANTHPRGVFLMTGTGIVPSPDFTLAAGDEVTVAVTGLGCLTNRVVEVGLP